MLQTPQRRRVVRPRVLLLFGVVAWHAVLATGEGATGGGARAEPCQARPLRVAIDTGHSLRDPGAISASGRTEFSFNRRFVKELLARAKSDRRLLLLPVNPSGGRIGLRQRVAEAKALDAAAMISIHHDSVNEKYVLPAPKSQKSPGVVSYAFRGFSMFVSRDNGDFELSVRLATEIGQRFKAAGFLQSLHHAEPIRGENRELLRWDLGLYDAPFAVVKAAQMPSVLLEMGVIVHPQEEAELDRPEVRARMARAILEALAAWCP
ncbi:MAG: N-acetylmuramoyl-L-alanine amidase family protein [Hyphomicrobiaceae bacterium]